MSDNKNKGCVLALGYFDSVHVGHRAVIAKAKEISDKKRLKTVVFTFDGNLRAQILGEKLKCIYLPSERKTILEKLNVDSVYFAPVTKEFLSLTKKEFLDKVIENFNVSVFVCGRDYRFGKFAEGDVDYLKEYASNNGLEVLIVNDVNMDGQKVSTTRIRRLLEDGEIKKANALLETPFFITGEVVRDRGVGKKMNYPTVNVKIDGQKQMPKEGVYKGKVEIEKEVYLAVINHGRRPTFGLDQVVTEAHIINFNRDVYGKRIKVIFEDYLRKPKKFLGIEELKEQLRKDVKSVEKAND